MRCAGLDGAGRATQHLQCKHRVASGSMLDLHAGQVPPWCGMRPSSRDQHIGQMVAPCEIEDLQKGQTAVARDSGSLMTLISIAHWYG